MSSAGSAGCVDTSCCSDGYASLRITRGTDGGRDGGWDENGGDETDIGDGAADTGDGAADMGDGCAGSTPPPPPPRLVGAGHDDEH
eukprot:3625186-Pleurochrysis_carterae.AAC.1